MEISDLRNLFKPCDILIPDCDMEKWSVVACDQHTSEPEYWKRVGERVGDSPSTLRLMLPEHTYKCPGLEKLVSDTKSAMADYKERGIFSEYKDSFVYVERTLYNGKRRCGIVGALDLECYDFRQETKPLVRATEGTVVEKLPVRVELRSGALYELPHVLMLADDPEDKLLGPLKSEKEKLDRIYDFELMEKGGHISGYRVSGSEAEALRDRIAEYGSKEAFSERYGFEDEAPMVFVVGDGNHSLASAKVWWDRIKPTLTEQERETHPARFALVEIVNICESSLEFQPINRVVFDVEPETVLKDFVEYFPGAQLDEGCGHEIGYVYNGNAGIVSIPDSYCALAVGALSKFLDEYVPKVGGRIDYVHGDDVVVRLAHEPHRIGFVLPAIEKSSFFPSIIKDGVLPRKTFSMGSANDKRYYLECRKITR